MKSNLIVQLEQAIQESEQEKRVLEQKIQALNLCVQYCNERLESYSTALKFAELESKRSTAFSTSPTRRYHTRPNQLVAKILKENSDKWLSLTDITFFALQLDGQNVAVSDITSTYRSAIHKVLKTMLERGIVEDKDNRESPIRSQKRLWRLKPLQA